MSNNVQIVVARYNENIDWLRKEPFVNNIYSVVIYDKGPNSVKNLFDTFDYQYLPNVGRESHTFLHHIYNNYDSLADITIFLPGSAMNGFKEYKTRELLKKVIETKDTVLYGKWYHDVANVFRNFSIGELFFKITNLSYGL